MHTLLAVYDVYVVPPVRSSRLAAAYPRPWRLDPADSKVFRKSWSRSSLSPSSSSEELLAGPTQGYVEASFGNFSPLSSRSTRRFHCSASWHGSHPELLPMMREEEGGGSELTGLE